MASKRNKWPWILAILPFVLVLAILPTRALIRLYIESQLGSEQYVEFRKYFDEPVTIPEEWREVEPFPDDLIEAASEYAKVKNATGAARTRSLDWKVYAKLTRGEDLTPDEWEEASRLLAGNENILEAFSRLVNHPEFDMGVLPIDPTNGGLDLVGFSSYSKMLCFKAHDLARRDEWKEAFECISTVFRGARHHSASTGMERMLAVVLVGNTVGQVEPLALRCGEPILLRIVLTEINELDSSINLEFPAQPFLVDAVGQLRIFKRLGFHVDLEIQQPPADFSKQVFRVMKSEYPDSFTQLDKFITSKSTLLRLRLERIFFENEVAGLIFPTHELALAKDWNLYSGFNQDARSTESGFNLARLFLVKRILELEGREMPTVVSELVPEFFEEEPLDPFNGEPYTWDSERGEFVGETSP